MVGKSSTFFSSSGQKVKYTYQQKAMETVITG